MIADFECGMRIEQETVRVPDSADANWGIRIEQDR
jgi:hypothetical protein